MRLFGTEHWEPVQIGRVITFERTIAQKLPELVVSMAAASDYADWEFDAESTPSDGPFALVKAAEIAFVTKQLELGVDICKELFVQPYARPRTVMQTAQWAVIGVVLGLARVRLDASGAEILYNIDSKTKTFCDVVHIPWPQSAIQMRFLAKRLIPAAIASGDINETVNPMLIQLEGRNKTAFSGIEYSDEFVAGLVLDDLSMRKFRNQAFLTLELAYSNRLTAMRRAPTWNTLRMRGNLIDWSLLLLYIARFYRKAVIRLASPQIQDTVFLRTLAKNIMKYRYRT